MSPPTIIYTVAPGVALHLRVPGSRRVKLVFSVGPGVPPHWNPKGGHR